MSEPSEEAEARLQFNDWEAISKRFPGSTFNSDRKSWRVLYMTGDTLSNPELKASIARLISRLEGMNMGMAGRPAQRGPPRAEVAETSPGPGLDVFSELAKEYGLEVRSPSHDDDLGQGTGLVAPEQVRVVWPSQGRISLYPRGFVCDNCHYYVIHTDLSKVKTLLCPTCKKASLRQVSYLFVCNHCGLQHEVTPLFTDPQRDGPVFKCSETGCDGVLKLDIRRPVSRSKWVCSKTLNEIGPVIYFCPSCSTWGEKKNPVRMDMPFTTRPYFRPVMTSMLYVGNTSDFDPETLMPSWSLSAASEYNEEQRGIIREFGIRDVRVIDDVSSYTAVYGYSPYGRDVRARFFKGRSPETNQFEYRAYVTQSTGKAMYIALDKERVVRTVTEDLLKRLKAEPSTPEFARTLRQNLTLLDDGSVDESYTWLMTETKKFLESGSSEGFKLASLFKLLHSMEHTLTYHASLKTGLEEAAFVGKVALDGCGVLLYERAQVEAGGVEYIAKDLLPEWLDDSMRHVRDCSYECVDGCVKCLYVQDPLCHPFLPRELADVYIFPNSLLSRALLLKFWGLPAPKGEPADWGAQPV